MENNNLVQVSKLSNKQKIVLYFLIYAFLGWILETIYCVVTLGVFQKRGFLYGPVCPIYGFGAIILIKSLQKANVSLSKKFFISLIVFTAFEYVVSVVLEELFGLRWWDYTNEILNFQGRISLPFSLAWGVIGVVFAEIIHPRIKSFLQRKTLLVSEKKQITILNIVILIILIDLLFSVMKYTGIFGAIK